MPRVADEISVMTDFFMQAFHKMEHWNIQDRQKGEGRKLVSGGMPACIGSTEQPHAERSGTGGLRLEGGGGGGEG